MDVRRREYCQQHNVAGVERHLQLAVKKMAIKEPVVLKMSDFSKLKEKMANGTAENSTHTQEGIG